MNTKPCKAGTDTSCAGERLVGIRTILVIVVVVVIVVNINTVMMMDG